MTQYGIKSESEIISGCILKLQKHLTERQDAHQAEKLAKLRAGSLWAKMREEFFEQWGGEENIDLTSPPIEVASKAKAWYTVTYSDEQESAIFGLPWIVWDVLACAKEQSMKDQGLVKLPNGEVSQSSLA